MSVIDGRYKLDEVGEAMRRIEEGNARGKVIITVASEKKGNLQPVE